MLPTAVKNRLSLAEYLELESQSEARHEYYYGELHEMPGVTKNHNHLTIGLIASLYKPAKKRGYSLVNSDVIHQLIQNAWYVYPDLSVVRDGISGDPYIVEEPLVVFEILSKSTEKYDRTEKREGYQQIPSLRQFVLVSQYEFRVESYIRQADGSWVSTIYTQPADYLPLPALEFSLLLEDIYSDVVF